MKKSVVCSIVCVLVAVGCADPSEQHIVSAIEDMLEARSDATGEGVLFFDPDTGESREPLAIVKFDNGSAVRFFDVGGGIEIAMSGALMTEPPIPDATIRAMTSASELYELLSGDHAPRALVEADRSAVSGRARTPARDDTFLEEPEGLKTSSTNGVGVTSQALQAADCTGHPGNRSYDEWFYCRFCGRSSGNVVYNHKWMWVSGSGSYSGNDVHMSRDTVSVYGGDSVFHSVSYRFWSSWRTPVSTYIKKGYYVSSFIDDVIYDHDRKAYVNNASGDSYHWCAFGED